MFGNADDRPYETALPGYGRTFPHPFGQRGDKIGLYPANRRRPGHGLHQQLAPCQRSGELGQLQRLSDVAGIAGMGV